MESFYQVLQKVTIENFLDQTKILIKFQIEADIEFVAPAHAEMLAYANNNISVYAYVFDYVPQVGQRHNYIDSQ